MSRKFVATAIVAGLSSLFLLVPLSLSAQSEVLSVGPAFDVPATKIEAQSAEKAQRIAQVEGLSPFAELTNAEAGAADQVEAMRARNRSNPGSIISGFTRTLPEVARVELGAVANKAGRLEGGFLSVGEDGSQLWSTTVYVENAARLRLRLDHVNTPFGAQFWVYGDHEEVSFGQELIDETGTLWTPSVDGPLIGFEVRIPANSQAATFEIGHVMEIFEGDVLYKSASEKGFGCVRSGDCSIANQLGIIDLYRRAVAQIQFVKNGELVNCSGALLNDTVEGSFIPYFLTANHCLSTQASATSLEAFWDFRAACGGNGNRSASPRSNGATLLATKSTTDFTLLRLRSIPGDRVFLGWNATLEAIPNGATLYRLSHPGIYGKIRPQTFSTTRLDIRAPEVPGLPATHYLYSKLVHSAVYKGSSGAPSINAEGQVLGQLLGASRIVQDICSDPYHVIDGAFARTLENVRRFLAPAQLDRSPCRASSTTVCLSSNRFEVKASYRFANGQSGNLKLNKHTNNTVLGYFNDRNNIEVLAKVLDGCTLNGTYWAFLGGVTDQHIFMRIRDTRTGIIQSYSNSLGSRFRTVADTSAFPCN